MHWGGRRPPVRRRTTSATLRRRLRRAAASLRSAAGFLPFATSPMTAAAASRAFDSDSAEQEPNGTRHFWPLSVYWQR